jgi:hypothetical protein
VLGRLSARLLLGATLLLPLGLPAAAIEAANTPSACGVRSPAAFVDLRGTNSISFQKTVANGDTLIWNTDDNRTLTPTTVRIRFVGRSFQVMARGNDFTIAGQGNLQSGNFGGSLVERKVVRETDASGRTKSRTLRTIRTVVDSGGLSQWVACPVTRK